MEKGILGKPKYKIGQRLYSIIKTDDGYKYISGRVFVVDGWGTFEQSNEPHYDLIGVMGDEPVAVDDLQKLYDENDSIIFKHIRESWVSKSQSKIRTEMNEMNPPK